MSQLGNLLDEAHQAEHRAGYHLTVSVVQRKANRQVLAQVAREFRRAADLIDRAVALMTKNGDRTQ